MKYTIILKRPGFMDIPAHDGSDIYVALVEAKDVYDGLQKARAEVFASDLEEFEQSDGDLPRPRATTDYAHVMTFLDHRLPKWWGWQIQ